MSTIAFYRMLFLAAFAFFAVFTPMGNIPSDTGYSIATAESIVRHGSLTIGNDPRLLDLREGLHGRYYSKFGIGNALLFTPAVAFSELAGRLAPRQKAYIEQFVISFTNTVLAAFIVVIFFMLFTALGYDKKVSLAACAGIATASLLLPYSKIVYAEIPSAMVVLLFMLAVVKGVRLDGKGGIRLGLCAALLILLKPGNVCYALVVGLYGTWLFIGKKGTIAGFFVFAGSGMAAIGLLVALNLLRYGNPFDTGYGADQTGFTTPILTGLAGLFLSPSKSLFLFSPLVIACVAALPRFHKKHPVPSTVMLCMTVLNILFYAKWQAWHGDWSWGPRLIVPSIILFHIALPEFIAACRKSVPYRYVMATLLCAGIGINMLGSLVWYQQVYPFHHSHVSVRYSHPVIAAKLLLNKLRDRPETYACRDFGLDCTTNDYKRLFGVTVRNDSLDFSDFEKFQGVATLWDGVRRNFHVPFLWIIPMVLLAGSFAGFLRLWRSKPVFG
jgi:hypothetical protein